MPLIYLLAIVAANLSVQFFGPASLPINAFFLIGLDLTVRDRLHDKWVKNEEESFYDRFSGPFDSWPVKMLLLIVAGTLLTFLIWPNAGRIGMASGVSFAVAALADTGVYHFLRKKSFIKRANGSNIVGAAVDSVLFPTLAFGILMPWAIVAQFAAKTLGGFVWSLILNRKAVAVALLLFAFVPRSSDAQIVSAHYDVVRQAPIVGFNYAQPVFPKTFKGKVFAAGFVESWYNPKDTPAFPSDRWTVFSKNWISYSLTSRLSLSTEIEVSRNMAGAWSRWPEVMPFVPDRWHVEPKIGIQLDLTKR